MNKMRLYINNNLIELEEGFDYVIQEMEENHKERISLFDKEETQFDLVVYKRERLNEEDFESVDDLLEMIDKEVLFFNKGVRVR